MLARELGLDARTIANLRQAILKLPHVFVFDNGDLWRSFRLAATYRDGVETFRLDEAPPSPW